MELITSRKNPKIQYWKKLAASASFRTEKGEYVCDGHKLLEEALQNRVEVTAVLTSEELSLILPEDTSVYRLPYELMEYVSPMKTPQTTLFTVRLPGRIELGSGERFMVLEGVQDPGNVGTVLRTARAMGMDAVLLLPGCADLYSPKTVRASMGAVFCQPAFTVDYSELEELKKSGLKLYGTGFGPDSVDVRSADFSRFACCIGSEGQGLSERVLRLCDSVLQIPMQKNCESLNAALAAGIIMWEAVRGKA